MARKNVHAKSSNDGSDSSLASAQVILGATSDSVFTGRELSGRKRVLRILRQTAIILFITCVLSEVAFRIYGSVNPTFIFYGNSYSRFRARPHSYHYDFQLNSKGFKDVEFKIQKEKDTFRVLGIGDSFAYGIVPYEYNYLTLLEEDLKRSGRKVEVINMGIGGTGPRDYLSLLAKEGLELKPDMVLLSFFIGNDFTDPSVEKGERSLASYSYLATFIKYLIDLRPRMSEHLVRTPETSFNIYYDDKPTFTEDYFFKLEVGKSEIYRRGSSLFERQFAEAVGYLKQIKDTCDARKIAVTVVLIPDEVQVNRTLQSKVMDIKTFSGSEDDFDFTLPNRMLSANLKELGIDCLDLLDDFTAAAIDRSLYKPADTHWNIAGNRLAATVIEKDLFRSSQAAEREQSAAGGRPSSYEGFLEATDCESIEGWAWDSNHPNDPVKVDVYDSNTFIGTVTADRFREDLVVARKGNGAHAFHHPVGVQLRDGRQHTIRLKISGTEFALAGSPKPIRCSME